jgi:hypothetical protein
VNDIDDRDQRFIDWFSKLNADVSQGIVNLAWNLGLPRRVVHKLAAFLIDRADGVGQCAGGIYCVVRDAGDSVRWFLTGKTR